MSCEAVCSVVVRWNLEGIGVYRTVLVCFSVNAAVRNIGQFNSSYIEFYTL